MCPAIPTPLQIRQLKTDTNGDVINAAIRLTGIPSPLRAMHKEDQIAAGAASVNGEPIYQDALLAGGEQESSLVRAFDIFTALYRLAQQQQMTLRLYVPNSALRDFLMDQAALPGVEVVDGLFGPDGVGLRAAFTDAGAAVTSLIDQLEIDAAPALLKAGQAKRGKHRNVYTDGSVSATRRGCGMAAVSEDGSVVTDADMSKPNRPVLAELLAIELAVRHFRCTRMTIHADSKDALRLLNGDGECWVRGESAETNRQVRATIRRIRDAAAGRTVRFQWVRGHAGNRYNDAADRAAKVVRRDRSFAIGGVAVEAVLSNIQEDLSRAAPAVA